MPRHDPVRRRDPEHERPAATGLRAFLGVPLPAAARERVATLLERLAAAEPLVRWTDPRRLHLTLVFLGDPVAEDRVPAIAAAIDEACRRLSPLEVALGGLGRFPTAGRPRVVWLGVTRGGDSLAGLQAAVAAAVAPLGFPPEARPWRPHVTLGRVPFAGRAAAGFGGAGARGAGPSGTRLADALAALRDVDAGGGLVDAVTLFSSTRSAAGPEYRPLHVSRLGDG